MCIIPMPFLWFNISGYIGTFFFFLAYEGLYRACSISNCASISWITAYILSIIWQHALHRYLVFGASGSYWWSLFGTYAAYTLSLIVSSALNFVLVTHLNVYHRYAFGLTLVITGILNFFTVRSAFKSGNEKNKHEL